MKWPQRVEAWWEIKSMGRASSPADVVPPNYSKKAVKIALAMLIAFHLLLPLRHWLFPGDVAWTEEGHRYAWRMMLRSKRGYGHFVIKNLRTGESTNVNLNDYLTDRQQEKIFTHPDMVLQFAHYLYDLWHRRGVPDVAIYANVRANLNGRKTQPFIDAKVDLAKVDWEMFKPAAWIMPLE